MVALQEYDGRRGQAVRYPLRRHEGTPFRIREHVDRTVGTRDKSRPHLRFPEHEPIGLRNPSQGSPHIADHKANGRPLEQHAQLLLGQEPPSARRDRSVFVPQFGERKLGYDSVCWVHTLLRANAEAQLQAHQ